MRNRLSPAPAAPASPVSGRAGARPGSLQGSPCSAATARRLPASDHPSPRQAYGPQAGSGMAARRRRRPRLESAQRGAASDPRGSLFRTDDGPRHRPWSEEERTVARVRRARREWLREEIYRACRGRCAYCGEPLARESATADHVHPIADGGTDGLRNLVLACAPCNRAKGASSVEMFVAQDPRRARIFLRVARHVHQYIKRSIQSRLGWRVA